MNEKNKVTKIYKQHDITYDDDTHPRYDTKGMRVRPEPISRMEGPPPALGTKIAGIGQVTSVMRDGNGGWKVGAETDPKKWRAV